MAGVSSRTSVRATDRGRAPEGLAQWIPSWDDDGRTSPVALDTSADRTEVDRPTRRSLGTRAAGGLVLLGLLLVAVTASLALGARDVPLGTVRDALTTYDAGDNDHLAVRGQRLPRTAIGLLAGAALG